MPLIFIFFVSLGIFGHTWALYAALLIAVFEVMRSDRRRI